MHRFLPALCQNRYPEPGVLDAQVALRLRRRALLNVALAALCAIVPWTLALGIDFSSVAHPAPPLTVASGDYVTLRLRATLENGTLVQDNASLVARVGSGQLVPGLDAALEGLARASPFNVSVPPEQAYGAWNATRVYHIPRNETTDREYSVSYAAFQEAAGAPYVGETVQTDPWNSTVVGTGPTVVLRYEPALNGTVHMYRYWTSTVTSFDQRTIAWRNDLKAGQTFAFTSRSTHRRTDVRVTGVSGGDYLLDTNPAYAGHTLRYAGLVLAIRPGSPVRRSASGAMSVGGDDCSRCHGGAGFDPLEASVSAVREGAGVRVNVTVDDPWFHDLRGVTLTVSADPRAHNVTKTLGDLRSEGSEDGTLWVPTGAVNGTIGVVIQGTAQHRHRSGGKPDDEPYRLLVHVPIGAPKHAAGLGTSVQRLARWGEAGRVAGFLALGALLVPGVQGMRRHWGLKPWFRRPAWLSSHFWVSAACVLLTAVHAEALMSGPDRGSWPWGTLLGLVAMLLLGGTALVGMVLAAWVPYRWAGARRLHYLLMLAVVALGLVHTVAVGSTLRAVAAHVSP